MSRNEYNFYHTFRVRYAEVDAQGIVFNAHYLTYFDCAMTEYLRNLEYDYVLEVKKRNEDFHTVKTMVEYKKPILFDQVIDCCIKVLKIGNSSLHFALEIHPSGVDGILAYGEVVWVNADQNTNKASPLPKTLRSKIINFEKYI